MAVVADQSQLSKLVHEMADPRSGGADHFGQCFLADIRADPLWLAVLAEIREQQQQPGKSPLALIEQLIDQVFLDPAVPGQEIGHEQLG